MHEIIIIDFMRMIMYMTTMGTEALYPVERQWGRPFQRVKEGVNLFYVASKRVAEADAFKEEFIKRSNADLVRLGKALRMIAMKLKRRGTTWPAAREAGQLPEPTFRGTVTLLKLAPLTSGANLGRRGACV